uniref:FAD-binding domain-containing protein n=1 Tax=Chromera velia CCMP2878 TaxID=1169474 RepID=A0A0G4GSL0_9ALVE|eukprot:Cvel_23205.t1-p1 / transcript=Cvel_23205.t1 / gene=Cvel_23205 / organism=Chromera_velia_CCMP2878 / gene_product=Conditioned medium factor receptor 1, putative / transcript_product=Conditioned medium factor receptor 1, putative / location=Cvel_scaffold2365:26367-28724(-) / protein_length=538 / sequence_SO=supercontig / SO=protein_coding / is_pseudo=false
MLSFLQQTRERVSFSCPSSLALGIGGGVAVVASVWLVGSRLLKARKRQEHAKWTLPEDAHDVLIVGGGPAGSTTAFFLSSLQKGWRVAVLERKHFPREKYCGDAWCHGALEIMDEMGVLEKLKARGDAVLEVRRGGFVSPSGFECVGGPYGSVSGVKTAAIKRKVADEALIRRAEEVGASLFEGADVQSASLVKGTGGEGHLWHVSCADGRTFRGRLLIICDGSTSYLAQKLGLVKGESQACCSHQYFRGCRPFMDNADGVMFFSKNLLPGYSALFKHADGSTYLGTYILPGGRATSRAIPVIEDQLMNFYPPVAEAFGHGMSKKSEESLTKMETAETVADTEAPTTAASGSLPKRDFARKVAPIRIGGVDKSTAKQTLIVGDAAGMVDPLTGEGIHTAMIAGKMAAAVVASMLEKRDFSEEAAFVFHQKWTRAFGFDFAASSVLARVLFLLPEAVDAMALVGQRKGQEFLDFFGHVMTGVESKSRLFTRLDYGLPIAAETLRQIFKQRVRPVLPAVLGGGDKPKGRLPDVSLVSTKG